MKQKILDLSVIVCSYNCQLTIRSCLSSVKKNNPKELILVDAASTDKTCKIARPFVDKIINDKRKGLGNARNMGLAEAKGKYIVFVGPDNIMPSGSLKKMIVYLEKYNCSIVSAVTALKDTRSYLGWAQNIYRTVKYKPGYKSVVGTPSLFKTAVLRKYQYDPFMKNSDDTDLCERMIKDGHKFAISDALVFEKGFTSLEAVCERWTRYGRGDCLFYKKYFANWSYKRKIQSFCHPLFTDFLIPIRSAGFLKGILIAPFLILITFLRYYGWLTTIINFEKIIK